MIVLLQLPLHGQRNKSLSREEYIKTFSELAMKEMALVGIPCQHHPGPGMPESNNGNSTLATEEESLRD